MFRRTLCCLMCLLLVLLPSLCFAEQGFTMAGFDGTDSQHVWSTNLFFTRMQERTGISFTFDQYNKIDEWQTAKDTMFSTGELADVLFKASLSTDELIRYTDSGQIIDLLPLLPEHAPNLWALLEANPDWLTSITLPNGKIGALPAIQPVPTQNVLWINQAWLDKLSLEMPADMASLKDVLSSFLQNDPNGNGKQDEVPLTFMGPWELKFLSHAYGVVITDYNTYLDDSGKVHFWPNEDSFIDMIADLRDMYEAKLLDQSGFRTADTLRRITDDEATLTYGAFFSPTPVNLLPFSMATDFVAVEPFAYEGTTIYRDLVGPITRGTFAITSAASDPAALLQWIDILYTEEGAIEAMLGKEGDAYIVDEDGLWQWKGGIENLSTTTINELSIYDSGEMPWLFPMDFYNQYAEESVRRINSELNKLTPYVKQPFPTYTLTTQQRAEVLALQNELGAYVDESISKFILGQTQITDETVSQFKQGLIDNGMNEMVSFWQSIADSLDN